MSRNPIWSCSLPVHLRSMMKKLMISLAINLFFCLFREAISRVCEAVPGAKGAFKKRKVFFFSCSEVAFIFLVQHQGDQAQQAGGLKQLWELQIINHLKYWLFSPINLPLSLLVRIIFYRHLEVWGQLGNTLWLAFMFIL